MLPNYFDRPPIRKPAGLRHIGYLLLPAVLWACDGPEGPPASEDVGQPPSSSALFDDITDEAGIDFLHVNGGAGEFSLPEITGSGGALIDYDNDGDLDLYIVQGASLDPGLRGSPGDDSSPRDRLYRNDLDREGDVRFTDVTEQSGISATGYGMGVATGDYDNDGWTDLYVTNLGSNQMLRNNGDGSFTDVTARTGTDDPRWSTSAAFLDFDRDGWMDLFLTNYVDFSVAMGRRCFSPNSARDYCGPDTYDPSGDRLFRNLGDGTFADVTESAGLGRAFGAGLGVVTGDFDGDGWTDIYVANDGDLNQLWINQEGRGSFEDHALPAGVAVNYMGSAEASMGVDAADIDGDGDLDLFMTHLEEESNTFYVNLGDGLFEDRTIGVGLLHSSLRYTGFGTGFFDYDNDGWLDILVLNGAVRTVEELARQGDPFPLHQRNQLLRNDGEGRYDEVTDLAGVAFELSEVSRGAALGDIDNDGDTDVVVFNNSGRARVLLNQVGNRQHWVGLRLLRPDLDQDLLQTRVEIELADGRVQWRRARADGSYCSANDPRVLIGLADEDRPVSIVVHWPDGVQERFDELAVDRYWTLRPGEGSG